jgi:ankyrin repeat protein
MVAAETDFWQAVKAGDQRADESFVAGDSRLASASLDGVSAILLAMYCHRPAVAASLRPHVAELDIFEACALGDLGRVKALLASDGRLANAVAEDGFGALGLACFFDHEGVVRALLASGALVDAASSNGMRVMPLHSAAAARSVAIARLLLEHGAPVNARQGQGKSGSTPLMEAAYNGQEDLVDVLMRHGADPVMRDEDGKRAADHARERGHSALAERLEGAAWS